MKKFDIGDRVIVIEDNEVKRGTIKGIYYELCTFIVEFADGSVGKVSSKNIALEPKSEIAEEKHEDAPRIKSEITITPDEFTDIAVRVIAKHTKDNVLLGMMIAGIMGLVRETLFSEESESSDVIQ